MQTSSEEPLVSVIVPAYNAAATIGRALRSVLEQDYDRVEAIVVNDASTDGTYEVVSKVQDPRLRILSHSTNRNAAAARNTGIAAAAGDFIAFLDADDEWTRGSLSHRVNICTSSPPGTVALGTQIVVGRSRTVIMPRRGPKRGESVAEYVTLGPGTYQPGALLVPAQLAKRVGFDERLKSFQDLDFGIRLDWAGARTRFTRQPLAIVHRDPLDSTHISTSLEFDHLLAWAERHGTRLSPEVRAAFLAKFVAHRALANGRRWIGFRLLIGGIWVGALETRTILSGLGRAVLPVAAYDAILRGVRSAVGESG